MMAFLNKISYSESCGFKKLVMLFFVLLANYFGLTREVTSFSDPRITDLEHMVLARHHNTVMATMGIYSPHLASKDTQVHNLKVDSK